LFKDEDERVWYLLPLDSSVDGLSDFRFVPFLGGMLFKLNHNTFLQDGFGAIIVEYSNSSTIWLPDSYTKQSKITLIEFPERKKKKIT